MYSNTLLRSFQALVVLCALTFYSCHKNDNSVTGNTSNINSTTIIDSTYVDSITYGGCNYAGEIIKFSFHIKGPGTFSANDIMWDFGDGTISTSDFPGHVYSNPGTYTIELTIDGKHLTRTIEITSYPKGSTYTYAMGGSRHWIGTGSGMMYESVGTGAIDMQMSIDVMNAGIVRLPQFNSDMTLNLITDDTFNKVLTFKHCTATGITLRYYYDADSMTYTNYWQQGHGYENLSMHTL
jgi:hypothetical protein